MGSLQLGGPWSRVPQNSMGKSGGRAVLWRAVGNGPPRTGMRMAVRSGGALILCRERGRCGEGREGSVHEAWAGSELPGSGLGRGQPAPHRALLGRLLSAACLTLSSTKPCGVGGVAHRGAAVLASDPGAPRPHLLARSPQPPRGTASSGSGHRRWSASRGTTTSSAPPSTRGSCPWRTARWAPGRPGGRSLLA